MDGVKTDDITRKAARLKKGIHFRDAFAITAHLEGFTCEITKASMELWWLEMTTWGRSPVSFSAPRTSISKSNHNEQIHRMHANSTIAP